ncbi:flavin-containing monooxygenase [Phreatobacter stygius]|uniref:Trimethylamine monooxygenase n=1 Tax=Phreatobacter stygius TaxID=1940610 RepID=A0A4D7B0T2_9HYPH|nr:NAD(P)/FAD-dependent oxidoreductase [Phreatobacter stygius]QCI67279.1 NAD(P)/FAD-dependent oxidoreductase [Phreatobacter stygius]
MVAQKTVCIIGAGISGLVAAKVFKQHGHKITVVERAADIGGVWEPSRSYPDVQTQSPKDLYRYTSKAMPASYPEWPKGPQVHQYLTEFARDHDLGPYLRLNSKVVAMRRQPADRPGWTLDIQTGDGPATSEEFDFVAVCTGQFSDKNVVDHPGAQDFTAAGGAIMHSSDYTDPATLKGKRVIVLGGSKSATDIAVNAVKVGAASVTNVMREPLWRIPYFLGGLINFKRIVYARAQEEMFGGWGQTRRARFGHAIAKPFVWANWRALESLLKTQLKLKKCGMVPSTPIETVINCALPIATPDYHPMAADGRIHIVLGTIARYDGRTVVLSTGERLDTDIVVQATGWKLGVPFLPEDYRAKLVEPDGQYRLYRLVANPDLPDMGFVGFNSSFATVLCAEMAANWLVRYADSQLARQPTAAEMRDNIEMMLRWKRDERPAASVYGGLCVAPFHFKHLDELLEDIGATTRKRSPLVEKFSPPDADAFGRYLASAPDYRASGE